MSTPPARATDFDKLAARLRGYKRDPWERRAQAISWAVGQAMLANRHYTEEDEWQLRIFAAKWYDVTEDMRKHGITIAPAFAKSIKESS
jgi:hypothetical protein